MKFFHFQLEKIMKKLKDYKGEIESSKLEEPDFAGIYSYADYLKWTFDGMVELINGKIFKMAPAPSSDHQTILMNFAGLIWQYLKAKPCRSFIAPFDVRLSKMVNKKQVDSVVQPDICIICDATKIDEKGCNGAPDMIVEILSPSTAQRDLELKYALYEENGVKEYWIVLPNDQTVSIFDLKENKFQLRGIYHRQRIVRVETIGLDIDLNEVFNSKFE
jgi:Uma2 family endonuclease